jgi:hypothetical protein
LSSLYFLFEEKVTKRTARNRIVYTQREDLRSG